MNSNMLCSKCGKRPAVVFISKIQGDDSTQEGLCLKCAKELGIKDFSKYKKTELAQLVFEKMPKPDDAADALALAICHGHASDSLMIKTKI